jgi:Prokaryotic E2 family A/Prokaryotic homologs of the JAB domain
MEQGMVGNDFRGHAERFLTAALRHPECRAGRLISIDASGSRIELDCNVEMPIDVKVDGASTNGVRVVETVAVRLWARYPWSSPSFYLRQDFPRDLPHVEPGPVSEPPRPCLIDGNQREYFFQFGLVELGVFHLVHQLVLWLQHAAEGTLIHHGRGWEPTLRRDLNDVIAVDAEACHAIVDRTGGYRVLKADFFRKSGDGTLLGQDAFTWLDVSQTFIALKQGNELFSRKQGTDAAWTGKTVCCLVWPDKLPSGKDFVSQSYMPETVNNIGALRQRVVDLGCGRSLRVFFDSLERSWKGYWLDAPIPVAIILCARRPDHLVGSHSNIELVPYIFDIHATESRKSLLSAGDIQPVVPVMQIDAINPVLLRNVSGAPEIPAVAMLGCGSVGSKMTMHFARSGTKICTLSDNRYLRPHNFARHALARESFAGGKAPELAKELKLLGQSPSSHEGDLVFDLAKRDTRKAILPKEARYAINTTASLGVREALSAIDSKELKVRLAEAALFGRGDGGFVLLEGASHNPTLCDLADELNATVSDERVCKLLFDPEFGLAEIQIGQGCGSLTMPMTDMRLSAMTAALTEELVGLMQANDEQGCIVVGARSDGSSNTIWTRQRVGPFEVVDIEGPQGWTARVSQRVMTKIRQEVARCPAVETGGVLIGTCSARLRTIIIVDVIEAPPDSKRSAACFVLGTAGLKAVIKARHEASGRTLFDVGTWHSHLADHGPSSLDRATARTLAAQRPPPSVLLIQAPTRIYALMHDGAAV